MSALINNSAVFAAGGAAYCIIELLYRARTHFSMFFCSGIAILIMYNIYHANRAINPLLFSLTACAVITMLELIFGIIFNITLKMGVWDYGNMPLNLLGQISLPFSIIWLLAGGGLYIIFNAATALRR